MVYVGGYMKDPTLSPTPPDGTRFAFVGSYDGTTFEWNWLFVLPKTLSSSKVDSLAKSGSYLLAAISAGSDTMIIMLNAFMGTRTGTILVVKDYKPNYNGCKLISGSTAIFILSGSKSILLELDTSKFAFFQNPRSLKDNNNNLDMHYLTIDPNGSFMFIAHTSTQSDTTIPTTSLPALTIEVVKFINF